MERSNRALADAASSSSPFHSHTDAEGSGGVGSSSNRDPNVEEEETRGDEARNPQLIQQWTALYDDSYGENLQLIRVSCAVIIPSFWFFVSMTLIFGIYGPSNFLLGPNSSILMKPNPLFVQYLKVEELEKTSNQPTLYGFYRAPPLDIVTTCSATHITFLSAGSHKEWVYFLNKGSQMNVSYNVNSVGSHLILVIAQGNEGLSEWLDNPSYANSTLSWTTINGSGMIQQDIHMSSSYYVAVANLNAEAVEVELNVRIRAFLYNTSGAYHKCSLSNGECILELALDRGNVALLSTPCPTGEGGVQWNMQVSYGPQWMTYITGIGITIFVMLVVFRLLRHCERRRGRRVQNGVMQSERTPLFTNKNDDLSSLGSSYDSVSQDGEDLENLQAIGSPEAKSTKDGEHDTAQRLCAICFDAPRDCFFLPCGHCLACFACATRISEVAVTCLICRRRMKKVRKIFTV